MFQSEFDFGPRVTLERVARATPARMRVYEWWWLLLWRVFGRFREQDTCYLDSRCIVLGHRWEQNACARCGEVKLARSAP